MSSHSDVDSGGELLPDRRGLISRRHAEDPQERFEIGCRGVVRETQDRDAARVERLREFLRVRRVNLVVAVKDAVRGDAEDHLRRGATKNDEPFMRCFHGAEEGRVAARIRRQIFPGEGHGADEVRDLPARCGLHVRAL